MVTGLHPRCSLPPTLTPPSEGGGKGGGDVFNVFFATFRFTKEKVVHGIKIVNCPRSAYCNHRGTSFVPEHSAVSPGSKAGKILRGFHLRSDIIKKIDEPRIIATAPGYCHLQRFTGLPCLYTLSASARKPPDPSRAMALPIRLTTPTQT